MKEELTGTKRRRVGEEQNELNEGHSLRQHNPYACSY